MSLEWIKNSISGAMGSLTNPEELDARKTADLIDTIDAIKRGDPDAKLTRAEIRQLADINASRVAEMKSKIHSEALAPKYTNESEVDAIERKKYWDSYQMKLDRVISEYQTGLEKITIGAKEDLADLKKAHLAMLALKSGSLLSPSAPGLVPDPVSVSPVSRSTVVGVPLGNEGDQSYNKSPGDASSETLKNWNKITPEAQEKFREIQVQLTLLADWRITMSSLLPGMIVTVDKEGWKAEQVALPTFLWTKTQQIIVENGEFYEKTTGGKKNRLTFFQKKSDTMPQAENKGTPDNVGAKVPSPETASSASPQKEVSGKSPSLAEKKPDRTDAQKADFSKKTLTSIVIPDSSSIKWDVTTIIASTDATETIHLVRALQTKIGLTWREVDGDFGENSLQALKKIIDTPAVSPEQWVEDPEKAEFEKLKSEVFTKLGKPRSGGTYEVIDPSPIFTKNNTWYKNIDNQWHFSYRSNPDYVAGGKYEKTASWKPISEWFDANNTPIWKPGYVTKWSDWMMRDLLRLNELAKKYWLESSQHAKVVNID